MSSRTNLRRLAVSTVAASTVFAAAQMPAAFAVDDTNVVVTGGSLSISAPAVGNLTGVTLDGTAKTTTATFAAFSATDARGSGAGWNVTVQATQFAEHNGTIYVASGATLPTSSLSMLAPTVAKSDGTSSAVPSITAGPYAIDAASAVKIASAAADGTGMGSYSFTQGGSLTLSVPASAYAKTYRSDVTVSVVTGP
jgi:WxL domain surface cell wall-binding